MPKILVVDDDKDILEALELMLAADGYDTYVMPKSDKVIDRTLSFEPDLIIMDVLLSGHDGRAICQTLKNNPRTRDIPVIMISAHPDVHESIRKCGADSFVAKPFSIVEMTSELDRLLSS
jgi:DNA-binding response OmpR family regulator